MVFVRAEKCEYDTAMWQQGAEESGNWERWRRLCKEIKVHMMGFLLSPGN